MNLEEVVKDDKNKISLGMLLADWLSTRVQVCVQVDLFDHTCHLEGWIAASKILTGPNYSKNAKLKRF